MLNRILRARRRDRRYLEGPNRYRISVLGASPRQRISPLGTPVVCLDLGGPPVIVKKWPDIPSRVVQPSTPGVTARRIALALDDVIGQRGEPDGQPVEEFTEGLLAAYSYAALGA